MDTTPASTGSVKLLPAYDPAVRLLIMAALLIGFGVYCMVDVLSGKYPYAAPGTDINVFGKWALNNIGQFVFTIAGLVALAMAIRHLRRRIIADDNGLDLGKGPIPWSSITKVDATQLADKDLLTIHCGLPNPLVLKAFLWKNFRDLAVYIESHVPADKVTR